MRAPWGDPTGGLAGERAEAAGRRAGRRPRGFGRSRAVVPLGRGPAVVITNSQDEAPVAPALIRGVARDAVRRLGIRVRGTLAITFIDERRMRRLNKRFCGHDRSTDVLSFRYDGEPIIGEVLVVPGQARRYARGHGVPYEEELARYVIHGLLHWMGYEDNTSARQRRMRSLEDRLLTQCCR